MIGASQVAMPEAVQKCGLLFIPIYSILELYASPMKIKSFSPWESNFSALFGMDCQSNSFNSQSMFIDPRYGLVLHINVGGWDKIGHYENVNIHTGIAKWHQGNISSSKGTSGLLCHRHST